MTTLANCSPGTRPAGNGTIAGALPASLSPFPGTETLGDWGATAASPVLLSPTFQNAVWVQDPEREGGLGAQAWETLSKFQLLWIIDRETEAQRGGGTHPSSHRLKPCPLSP